MSTTSPLLGKMTVLSVGLGIDQALSSRSLASMPTGTSQDITNLDYESMNRDYMSASVPLLSVLNFRLNRLQTDPDFIDKQVYLA